MNETPSDLEEDEDDDFDDGEAFDNDSKQKLPANHPLACLGKLNNFFRQINLHNRDSAAALKKLICICILNAKEILEEDKLFCFKL